MRSVILKTLCSAAILGAMGLIPTASADVISPIQSTAKPLGLSAVAPVELAGSDAQSIAFMSALPALKALITTKLPEYHQLNNAAAMAVDPASLRLTTDAAVRVYFISEGASYHSALGFNTFAPGSAIPTATTPRITTNAELIFPDASSSDPGGLGTAAVSVRTSREPLLAGDYVDLGTFSAGTLLDPFLIAGNGSNPVLTAETARNADNFQHIVAFTLGGSPYLFLSFEDAVSGGDKDYNDVVFAMEFSQVSPTMTPEPGTWASLVGLCLLIGANTLRNKNSSALQKCA